MAFTSDQLNAINKKNTNIIVSAGAGSGKTAVLSERVLRILKEGTHIDELLVLTFTNAAAAEMKERIRKKIKEHKELLNELDLIDASYITTFDSFALSMLKKYHYLLNISNKVNIIDSNVINIEKKKYIDELFEEYYENEDTRLLKLIETFCIKDDEDIKQVILDISNKLDLKVDKTEYLNNYIDNEINNIDKFVDEYEELIKSKIIKISKLIDRINNTDYKSKMIEELTNLFNSTSYDEIRINLEYNFPQLRNDEETKQIRDVVKGILDELKTLTLLTKEELKESVISTIDYQSIIVEIINRLDLKIDEFKFNNNSFEFNDISKLLIRILKEHKDIREELKNKFKEILVDEYQDTNDIQEEFIKLIENNNVYMVGDIKQSIYRFRNANPYIFKNKYDKYSTNDNGIKIDLLKNFRSREEVLNDINLIFNQVMTDEIGGADYVKSHNMVFGNISYNEEGKTNNNNNMELITYDNDSKEESEAFIICNDIIDKVNNKYQIFDKDKKELRDAKYSDFVILIDRTSTFDLFKQIFTYKNVPLTVIKEEKMNADTDLYLIKNIIKLVIKNEIDKEYEYLYMSIARSFLFRLSDQEIYTSLINNDYNNIIIDKINKIREDIDNITPTNLIDKIIKEFNYYENLLKINNIKASLVRLDKIKEYASNLEELGYGVYDFSNYLEELISKNYDLTYSYNDDNSDSVKIMTIHKSKGLEYSICYFPGLYKGFNTRDIKQRFTYDNTYGIITPYFKEGIGTTFLKTLMKERYIKEEISEKIRLFYVALTRAKEKMIFVLPNKKNIKIESEYFKSFKDILDYIDLSKYEKHIEVEIEDYKIVKDNNIYDVIPTNNKILKEKNIILDKQITVENTYSKHQNTLIDKTVKENMEYGKKVHEEFELEDFHNTNNTNVLKLLKHFDIEGANIIKEYEFIYEDDSIHHGVIDLMFEFDNRIDIIDYKLKHIKDEAYLKQLSGYKSYIEKLTNKQVNTYLYSILDDEVQKL